MCSTPKSHRSRSSRPHRTAMHLTAIQAARFTAIANAADDRRQALKAHQKLLKEQNPESQSQKNQIKGWRYWMMKACLFSLLKQRILGRILQHRQVFLSITDRKDRSTNRLMH